jgi:hypothetical protein
MSRAITESEFNEWLTHPVTIAMREILAAKREELRQQWEGGSFTDYDQSTMALVNVGNIGTCKGYAFVQELTYESYITEIDDGEQKRTGPEGRSGPDQEVRAGTEGRND